MAKKIEIISTSELAKMIMVSPERVRQLEIEGVLHKVSHGNFDLALSLHGYFRSLRRAAYGPSAAQVMEDNVAEIHQLQARIKKLEANAKR